jgi:predicted aspartyl protease
MRKPGRATQIFASAVFAIAVALPAGWANAATLKGDYVGKTPAEIVKGLERQGYKVGEHETERGYFEVKASIDGKWYEILVDPETGKVAKIRKDD